MDLEELHEVIRLHHFGQLLLDLPQASSGQNHGERPAGGRAQLQAKRRSIGQMQISAELVPIPDASGCVRMRPDASGF